MSSVLLSAATWEETTRELRLQLLEVGLIWHWRAADHAANPLGAPAPQPADTVQGGFACGALGMAKKIEPELSWEQLLVSPSYEACLEQMEGRVKAIIMKVLSPADQTELLNRPLGEGWAVLAKKHGPDSIDSKAHLRERAGAIKYEAGEGAASTYADEVAELLPALRAAGLSPYSYSYWCTRLLTEVPTTYHDTDALLKELVAVEEVTELEWAKLMVTLAKDELDHTTQQEGGEQQARVKTEQAEQEAEQAEQEAQQAKLDAEQAEQEAQQAEQAQLIAEHAQQAQQAAQQAQQHQMVLLHHEATTRRGRDAQQGYGQGEGHRGRGGRNNPHSRNRGYHPYPKKRYGRQRYQDWYADSSTSTAAEDFSAPPPSWGPADHYPHDENAPPVPDEYGYRHSY